MKIKYFGVLRQKTGAAEQEGSGATIREVLENACSGNEALRSAILDGNRLQPYVRVMVNGIDIEMADGLATAVSDRDQIAIFPPIAGG